MRGVRIETIPVVRVPWMSARYSLILLVVLGCHSVSVDEGPYARTDPFADEVDPPEGVLRLDVDFEGMDGISNVAPVQVAAAERTLEALLQSNGRGLIAKSEDGLAPKAELLVTFDEGYRPLPTFFVSMPVGLVTLFTGLPLWIDVEVHASVSFPFTETSPHSFDAERYEFFETVHISGIHPIWEWQKAQLGRDLATAVFESAGNKLLECVADDYEAFYAEKERNYRMAVARGGIKEDPSRIDELDAVLGRTTVLAIAVDEYDHETAFKSLGGIPSESCNRLVRSIGGFSEVEIAGGAPVVNPTREDLLQVLKDVARRNYASNDQLLIYFDGHGDYDPELDMGYLTARDSWPLEKQRSGASLIPFSQLSGILDKSDCKHILIIINSCYSGALFDEIGHPKSPYAAISPLNLERELLVPSRLGVCAGGRVKVPNDRKFADGLIGVLEGSADIIEFADLRRAIVNHGDEKGYLPSYGTWGRQGRGGGFYLVRASGKPDGE